MQSSGYRLLFTSAICGTIFLFVATILSSLALATCVGNVVSDAWHKVVPLEHSGKAALAFLFGALLWWPLNRLGKWERFHFLSDDASIDREVARARNPLEVLLREAMKSQNLVSVSVKNGKVYIGRVTSAANPAFGTRAINLVLRRSGHRDKDTQELMIDVDYDVTHAPIKAELGQNLLEQLEQAIIDNPQASERELVDIASRTVGEKIEARNYEIVIPIEEVQSVNIFDMDIYERFFAPDEEPREFVPPP